MRLSSLIQQLQMTKDRFGDCEVGMVHKFNDAGYSVEPLQFLKCTLEKKGLVALDFSAPEEHSKR